MLVLSVNLIPPVIMLVVPVKARSPILVVASKLIVVNLVAP